MFIRSLCNAEMLIKHFLKSNWSNKGTFKDEKDEK